MPVLRMKLSVVVAKHTFHSTLYMVIKKLSMSINHPECSLKLSVVIIVLVKASSFSELFRGCSQS